MSELNLTGVLRCNKIFNGNSMYNGATTCYSSLKASEKKMSKKKYKITMGLLLCASWCWKSISMVEGDDVNIAII